MVRLVIGVGDVDLQLAESAAERGEFVGGQRLAREAQHAVFPKCPQHSAEVGIRQRLREIDAGDVGTEGLSA